MIMGEILFYLFCFFPFISPPGIRSHDIQPYCLVYTMFLFGIQCAYGKMRINKIMCNLYLIIIIGIVSGIFTTFILNGFDFSGVLRYLATYCGLILISYMNYTICMKNDGLNEKLVKIIINIWLIVGLIQLFVSREFCSNIVANARTSSNRGVVSLASEPSFYGYMCILFALLVLEFQTRRFFYWMNLLFQIVFLAKSSVTMVYLMVLVGIIGLYFLKKGGVQKIIIFMGVLMCAISGCGYLAQHIDSDQRIFRFLRILFSGEDLPAIIGQLGSDGSIYIRFNDIWTCVKGFILYAGFPHGFHTRKISSGYGSVLYTMGWIGFIMIVYLFKLVNSAYSNKMAKSVIPVFLTIILFSAIQLSNPVIGFLIGFYMYKRQNRSAGKLGKLILQNSKCMKLRE